MQAAAIRPPPLPARRSRHLALLITGLVLGAGLLVCAGLAGIVVLLAGRFSSGSGFSMVDYQCDQNLGEIALLKEEWATAHGGQPGDVLPPAECAKLLAGHGGRLICPQDPQHTPQTSYEVGPLGADPRCKCRARHHPERDGKA